jgi:hypothetical protein
LWGFEGKKHRNLGSKWESVYWVTGVNGHMSVLDLKKYVVHCGNWTSVCIARPGCSVGDSIEAGMADDFKEVREMRKRQFLMPPDEPGVRFEEGSKTEG